MYDEEIEKKDLIEKDMKNNKEGDYLQKKLHQLFMDMNQTNKEDSTMKVIEGIAVEVIQREQNEKSFETQANLLITQTNFY